MVLRMTRLIAIFALFLSAPLLFAADLSGIWLYSAKQPDGHTARMVLALQQSGTSLSGKIEHPWGTLEIKEGKVEGNAFSLTAPTSDGRPYTCEGTLEGDKLHFTVRDPNAKPYEVVAVRSESDPFRIATPLTPPVVRDLPPKRTRQNSAHGVEQLEPLRRAHRRQDRARHGRRHGLQRHARCRLHLRQHRRHLGRRCATPTA